MVVVAVLIPFIHPYEPFEAGSGSTPRTGGDLNRDLSGATDFATPSVTVSAPSRLANFQRQPVYLSRMGGAPRMYSTTDYDSLATVAPRTRVHNARLRLDRLLLPVHGAPDLPDDTLHLIANCLHAIADVIQHRRALDANGAAATKDCPAFEEPY